MKKIITILILSLIMPICVKAQEHDRESTSTLKIQKYPQSFEDLITPFKGKVIYIDLMASWCKPCITELRAAKQLESYFDNNNIVRLYISIDNKEDIEKAIRIIQGESLSGYFISYHPINPSERSAFSSKIDSLFLKDEQGNMSISIPKYAIVNKNGKIVKKRAERPTNPASLKEQLEIYLKE